MDSQRLFRLVTALLIIGLLVMGCGAMQTPSAPTPSTVSQAESIAKEYALAFETRDVTKFASLHAENALYTDCGVGDCDKPVTISRYLQELQALLRYVTSFEVKIKSFFVSADGKYAVLRGSYTDWGKSGLPATVSIVIIAEIQDGKIVGETAYYDGSQFRK